LFLFRWLDGSGGVASASASRRLIDTIESSDNAPWSLVFSRTNIVPPIIGRLAENISSGYGRKSLHPFDRRWLWRAVWPTICQYTYRIAYCTIHIGTFLYWTNMIRLFHILGIYCIDCLILPYCHIG
jgi:hypothetical protein